VTSSRRGAYGLAFDGLEDAAGLLDPPVGWPSWSVEQRREGGRREAGVAVFDHEARIGLAGGGEIRLDRERRAITFATPEPLTPEAILHPGLSAPAAIASWWLGRTPLHASAVVLAGRAWAIVGERGSGKSTMAALLVRAGCGFLTDDLLVVDGDRAYAGPASIDLRADAGVELGAQALGRVGSRERWRRAAPVAVVEAPLAGMVVLAWAAGEPCLTAAPVPERMAALAAHSMLPLAPEGLLELLALPAIRLSRAPGLGDAARSAELLGDALAGE
jgi:hypothetical protein